MILLKTIIILFILPFVDVTVYVFNTVDGPSVEQYDCIVSDNLYYCRRPAEPIALNRSSETLKCYHNGSLHSFANLTQKNVNISTVLHQWKSSVEKVEQYTRYSNNSANPVGFICHCTEPLSFGKNCEYRLPMGETLAETLQLQNDLRRYNPRFVQQYGDILCYKTLECNSGMLCLDWRDICDGVQQCMSGLDEDNCDKLEYNECETDEYRCMNGMCVSEEYFLDGVFDCLDWSDEIQYYNDANCPIEAPSVQCDDRICPPNEFSCGDGQCIRDRVGFQKASEIKSECRSQRHQYHMCETNFVKSMWTLPNGRCFEQNDKEVLNITNLTIYDQCEYTLRCFLSQGLEIKCPCDHRINDTCQKRMFIQYSKVGIFSPYMLFFYARLFPGSSLLRTPTLTRMSGIIKCNGIPMNFSNSSLQYVPTLQKAEDIVCANARNKSKFNNFNLEKYCQNQNQSFTFDNRPYNFSDICTKTKKCISTYRIKDGFTNCVDEMDESNSSISTACAGMQRYRFRCSTDEPTCLSVTALGNLQNDCKKNKFDEFWFGTSTRITDINCKTASKDQCKRLRQYIEDSWTSNSTNQVGKQLQIPFRHHCDTFWNLDLKEDENMKECRDWWQCADEQWRCANGQCIDANWVLDGEWDCSDASDEDEQSDAFTVQRNQPLIPTIILVNRSISLNKSIPFSSLCDLTTQFPCLPFNFSNLSDIFSYNRPCISKHRIGDGHIDCYGAIDERNTIDHCNQQSMLGYHFKCSSTKNCIPYWKHCIGERCNKSIDDESWCGQRQNFINCNELFDALCFNGTCVKNGRCNRIGDCQYGEDEYMCEYQSISTLTSMSYRKDKETIVKETELKLRLIRFPSDSNATEPTTDLSTSVSPTLTVTPTPNQTVAPISYWCNRGVGVMMYNGSIACFCPPQYYGDKCQFHTDRINILIHLNLIQSIYTVYTDIRIVLKLLVLFLFRDEVIMNHAFNVRPATGFSDLQKKPIHLLYSRSLRLLQHKKQRYFNQSNIIDDHPYSVRIEIYERQNTGNSLLTAVWQYRIYFDFLPVFRFSKVLRLTKATLEQNPCSSNPCNRYQDCQPLQNNNSEYICLCKGSFTGESCSILDLRCMNGYCSLGSICKPTYRGLVMGNELPYCVCPFEQFGERCDVKHDRCQSTPCQNNGSCFVAAQPDTVSCICTKEYHGKQCEMRKPEIKLFINETLSHTAAVIQYFDVDFVSLDLILAYQEVHQTLRNLIEYRHEQKTAPEIILVKLYSSHENIPPDLYLISIHVNVTTISATTQVTEKTRCARLRTSDYSPIRYHSLCRNNTNLFCFHDDNYLCICDENHARVECFRYDSQLDQCSDCLSGGRCVKGDHQQSNDYICLCPPCRSGRWCQFDSNSFAFTLDQLFFTDLNSAKRQKITLSLLIIIPCLLVLIGLLNNLLSFSTFRREKCLANGTGYYLLCISIINQIDLSILLARLIHLSVNMIDLQAHHLVDEILCRVLNYLLICFTRIAYWLISFVATERVYTIIFLKGLWLKKPYVARRLIALVFFVVFVSSAYELVFVKLFYFNDNGYNSMCVIEFPITSGLNWTLINLIVSIIHSMLPILINLCCTITMIYIIIRTKMNIRRPEQGTGGTERVEAEENGNQNLETKETRHRLHALRDSISENKEILTRPAITLIPSIFSLFSLPLLLISFSLNCRNIEDHPIRYALLVFYFLSYIPQIFTFFLYVYPASLYFNEWRLTNVGQWMTAFKRRNTMQNTIILSTVKEETLKDLSGSKQE